MKKIDENLKLLVAIIVVLGLSLSVMAQPQKRRQMPQQSMKAQSGFQSLDLTEDQQDQIKQIHLAHMKDVQPLIDELKINRAKINAILNNDDPDMKQIVSLVETDAKLLTRIQVKSIEQKINVRSHLSEEQKIIFDAYSEKMGKHRSLAQHYSHRSPAEIYRF